MAGSRGAERGAWLSLAVYGLLTLVKLAVSGWAGSSSLRADGLNNLTDVASSVAVLAGLRIAGKPRDANHPYGHSRAEAVATLVTSFIMVTVGLQVVYSSLVRFSISEPVRPPEAWAAWTALLTTAGLLGLCAYNRTLARRVNSLALYALSRDNLADALISGATVLAVVAARTGLVWLDPLVAMAIGAIICKNAWSTFSAASHVVTDGFDQKTLERYRETVLEVEGVCAVNDIKARYQGSAVAVDVTVAVRPDLNVVDSHRIADQIEGRLQQFHQVEAVHVHVEPVHVPAESSDREQGQGEG